MKSNRLWIAALAMVFVACNNEPFFEETQEDRLLNSVELKNDGASEGSVGGQNYLGFTPNEMFFYDLGEWHNDCLDYLRESLAELPRTTDGILALEVDLFRDFAFRKAIEYLSQDTNLSLEELNDISGIWSGDWDIDYLRHPEFAPSNLMAYWYDANDILMSDNYTADEAVGAMEGLFLEAYGNINMETITQEEFSLLSSLCIAKSSLEYWGNADTRSAYAEAYQLEVVADIPDWRSASILDAVGSWIGSIWGEKGSRIGSAVGSFIEELIEEVIDRADLSPIVPFDPFETPSLSPGEYVQVDGMVLYRQTNDPVSIYGLYNAISETQNPYITGDYGNMELPLGLSY